MRTVAIVPAAGTGERLAAGVPKAFAELAGRLLIERTVAGLRESGVVDAIVVAVPPGHTDEATLLFGSPEIVVIEGGADRTESVRLALGATGPSDFVLVHDAARPLTPPGLITRVVEALRCGHNAVVPTLPVADTIKVVDANDVVLATPERAGLRAAQTPQGFATEVLVRAYDRADSLTCTDDASMVELTGVPVQTVPGDALAFKITRPLDLLLAGAILAERTQP